MRRPRRSTSSTVAKARDSASSNPPSDAGARAPAAIPFPILDEKLLALLRCPVTMQPLSLAPAALLARIAPAHGPPLAAALLRADGTIIYPIRDGIPVLLAGAALPVPTWSEPRPDAGTP